MLRKQSERDERELGLMIKCLGWLRPVVLTVRGALVSAANLLTTGVLPASPARPCGVQGYLAVMTVTFLTLINYSRKRKRFPHYANHTASIRL
ncbi:hypothetical protein MHYP_G00316970 [Metynnis hypsauchen]